MFCSLVSVALSGIWEKVLAVGCLVEGATESLPVAAVGACVPVFWEESDSRHWGSTGGDGDGLRSSTRRRKSE